MSGADIGWLSVYRCSKTDQETLLWSMNKEQGEEWKQVQINLMDSGNNEHTKVGGVNIHELFFIFSLWESMISASENHYKSYLSKPPVRPGWQRGMRRGMDLSNHNRVMKPRIKSRPKQ